MNEDKGLFEGRLWIVVVLAIAILFGWQMHLAKKYPQPEAMPADAPAATEAGTQNPGVATAGAGPSAATLGASPSQEVKTDAKENTLLYDDEFWSFEISSFGMGIKNVVLKTYKDREGKQVLVTNDTTEGAFETRLVGSDKPLQFQLNRLPNGFKGTAVYPDMTIEKTMIVDSVHYVVETNVVVTGMHPGVSGVSINVSDVVPPPGGGFISSLTSRTAPADTVTLYVSAQQKNKREILKSDAAAPDMEPKTNVSVVSVGRLYFAQAFLDQSEIHPEFTSRYTHLDQRTYIKGDIKYVFPAGLSQANLKYKAFFGPKSIGILSSIDENLEGLVDFSVFSAIAKPMLSLMRAIFQIFGNWGVAIILLTLIVRTLVLPLYISSFKSMKGMQKIQPQMKILREKYKSEPQKLNVESMKLFKENGVNPFGSCLPMLLQLPIFLALYRVFSQSIELYQQPFVFWIKDLSMKDPYFVLPVLMGLSMFLQQKVTPNTTMDPAQQKMMQFMPLIFSAFMLTLPSGLTLYILVSTLYGITQQMIFMKDKNKTSIVKN